ncbi:capsule assembly Wzi family protein [Flavihumibacter sp. RY-1]|uniref:Capsule assembly Wzi family protein n=1 Tax=Flavihumibacter fluminis TaxID=2909236 RepID=A0ABS9BI43_9BACT|nr:capsule assembly Wzi family protein [Flavihumibacter fluminis]MCF1715265.1 capsule assembly Wzi family protein [Flavihumibacter fluminis]
MCSIAFRLLVFVSCIVSVSQAQTIQVGQSALEEWIRRSDLKDSTGDGAGLLIRPVTQLKASDYDSLLSRFSGGASANRYPIFNGKGTVRLLPASFQQQYNSHHSYGWNDGSLFPAKGYQLRASAGIAASYGILSVQFQPEFVYAANPSFKGFSPYHSDSTWYYYYQFQNDIDMPERFGNGALTRMFPGQSSVRLNYKGMSLGISSENLWWGPGYRNSLLMSNTAPGFYHLSFNSTRPHKTFLGKFEWQLIAGKLENSGILPVDTSRRLNGQPLYEPKKNSDRYINAVVITWQPKWIRGLHLGFARSFFQYSDNIPGGLNGYLPVFSAFFKGNARDEMSFGRDQLLSLFFRWKFPKEQMEIYGEWGRNDHSGNLSDLLMEPEHSRAYILGFRKLFKLRKDRELEFFTELTQLETPPTKLVRALQPWYAHYQVQHGYTNRGQVLGAGIGPGSNSQTIGVNWIDKQVNKTGVSLERIVRNNDFYFLAFSGSGDYRSHWVDIGLTGTRSWVKNRIMYTANLSLIRSLNYQWKNGRNDAANDPYRSNVNHMQVGLTVGYLF